MKQQILEIVENLPLTGSLMKMKLAIGEETAAAVLPGQFINIRIDGLYLRRPISVDDVEAGELTIIYKVVGQGTEKLRGMTAGQYLDVLLPLGNGFSLEEAGDAPLLVGGGVGSAPLYYLAKKLLAAGKKPAVVLGFRSREEIFLKEEFEALGLETVIVTEDGSEGRRGFVTDAVKDMAYSCAYVCGPEPMLKAVYKVLQGPGQYSFEERMGCGFGACMGCSCKTVTGYKRICKDGPVMRREELLWED